MVNKTLRVLNLESNRLSGEGILRILEATVVQKTVQELHVANQSQRVLGVKMETKMMNAILDNTGLFKIGLDFEIANSRIRVHDHLQDNLDQALRVTRKAKKAALQNGSK